ncbi:MAG: hypothetical protein JW941_12460 [Candidatus Coatesbacteria bacterium]|nr:hypothetical protein [Candidatus Coatesbacteria bacterium]
MVLENIFSVSNNDLIHRGTEEATEIFEKLLWAEARRIGAPVDKITIRTSTPINDGGVDASITDAEQCLSSRLIMPGCAAYQIKTGSSFQPWTPSDIKDELFGRGKEPDVANLKGAVKIRMDSGATYVLVCFGLDFVDTQRPEAQRLIKGNLENCGYREPKVEVWGVGQLKAFFDPFPSLSLWLKGIDGRGFRTHSSWSRDRNMNEQLVGSPAQLKAIADIQSELRKSNEPIHIRILGEPGIGKTRIALEATRAEDIQPLTIYSESAGEFLRSQLLRLLLADDNHFSVIIVIDETDRFSCANIWDKLKPYWNRLKIITIYNEEEQAPAGDIRLKDAPRLADSEILKVIRSHGNVPQDNAPRWVEYCTGSPRVAHVIGTNLALYPDDILRDPETVPLWDRYIAGYEDRNSTKAHENRQVLEHVSLFKRFGWREYAEEGQFISSLVHKAHPSIGSGDFNDVIARLSDRKILQGDHTLYITPKLLQIKLWADWWEKNGCNFEFKEFAENLPEKLKEWFFEMFKYAKESETSSRAVRKLLGPKGPFQHDEYLRTHLGARFFLALAEAEPGAALECLKRTVGTWSREEILQFRSGRRETVWALEKILYHAKLFPDAARILLALAESENEDGLSNNASGVFSSLFSAAYGSISMTGAPPKDRFPVLIEALDSDSRERRMVGLKAIEMGLRTHHSRLIGAEYQGLKEPLKPWMPTSQQELDEVYRRLWTLLTDRIDSLSDEEQKEAARILMGASFALVQYKQFAKMVTDTISDLADRPYIDKRKTLPQVSRILARLGDRMTPELRQKWEKTRDKLVGTGFTARLKRFVGTAVLEEDLDDKHNIKPEVTQALKALAREAAENRELLDRELNWLLTEDAIYGYSFGYELAQNDPSQRLLASLFDAQASVIEKPSLSLLSGYLRFLYEKRRNDWEGHLDKLFKNETYRRWIPPLTWRSGLTNRAVRRVLTLSEFAGVPLETFYAYGRPAGFNTISERVFKKWIASLLGSGRDSAISAALGLFRLFYLEREDRKQLPQRLTARLLSHPSFLETGNRPLNGRDSLLEYEWADVGREYVKQHAERALALGKALLRHLGKGIILERLDSEALSVLNMILERFPKEMSLEITRRLGPPFDELSYDISEWLRGSDRGPMHDGKRPAIYLMDIKAIWGWVEQKIEERAWFLAYRLIPDEIFHGSGDASLTREMLKRFGRRRDIRDNLTANLGCESWCGEASEYLHRKQDKLREFMRNEDDPNVLLWCNEYLEELKHEIERHSILEERMAF